MKKNIFTIAITASVLGSIISAIPYTSVNASKTKAQELVKRDKSKSYKGSNEIFTGNVTVTPIFNKNEVSRFSTAYVTFEAGARSAWHTHPAGQHLIIVDGTAWTQTWNGKKQIANRGDAIWCPPDVKHWHGASSDKPMTHIAITGYDRDGKNVNWMEKVTDEQYMSK